MPKYISKKWKVKKKNWMTRVLISVEAAIRCFTHHGKGWLLVFLLQYLESGNRNCQMHKLINLKMEISWFPDLLPLIIGINRQTRPESWITQTAGELLFCRHSQKISNNWAWLVPACSQAFFFFLDIYSCAQDAFFWLNLRSQTHGPDTLFQSYNFLSYFSSHCERDIKLSQLMLIEVTHYAKKDWEYFWKGHLSINWK